MLPCPHGGRHCRAPGCAWNPCRPPRLAAWSGVFVRVTCVGSIAESQALVLAGPAALTLARGAPLPPQPLPYWQRGRSSSLSLGFPSSCGKCWRTPGPHRHCYQTSCALQSPISFRGLREPSGHQPVTDVGNLRFAEAAVGMAPHPGSLQLASGCSVAFSLLSPPFCACASSPGGPSRPGGWTAAPPAARVRPLSGGRGSAFPSRSGWVSAPVPRAGGEGRLRGCRLAC